MFKKLDAIDKSLAGTVLILALIGAGAVFISGYHLSLKNRGYPYYYSYNHILTLIATVPLVLLLILTPIEWWKKYSPYFFLFALILVTLVFLPGIGKRVSGASRWVQVAGLSFQPSEILKVAMIACLSYMISHKKDHINHLTRGIIPLISIIILSSGVVAVEPDLSTSMMIFITGFFLIYINQIRFIYLLLTFAIILPLSLLVFESRSYFVSRLYFFLADSDPYGRGYHILQALKSYRLGGLMGIKEDALLSQALYFPDIHTDFIFSMLARIGGLGLVLFVLILYFFMLYRGYRISISQNDRFSRNLGLGITFLIALEILTHIAVNVGLAPTTGSVLPFISYGRTSIFTHALMLGVLLNLSTRYARYEKLAPSSNKRENPIPNGMGNYDLT